MSIATFGAGCFWCVEAVFQNLSGVTAVTPGYSNGHLANPTYKEVCTGGTGHAEVIRIDFDDSVISFETLVEIVFHVHNPTTLNYARTSWQHSCPDNLQHLFCFFLWKSKPHNKLIYNKCLEGDTH